SGGAGLAGYQGHEEPHTAGAVHQSVWRQFLRLPCAGAAGGIEEWANGRGGDLSFDRGNECRGTIIGRCAAQRASASYDERGGHSLPRRAEFRTIPNERTLARRADPGDTSVSADPGTGRECVEEAVPIVPPVVAEKSMRPSQHLSQEPQSRTPGIASL